MELTLDAIAKTLGAELHGDPDFVIRGICDWKWVKQGGTDLLAWQAAPLQDEDFLSSPVRAVLVQTLPEARFLEGRHYLVVEDARYAFAQISEWFHPVSTATEMRIHETAVVHETVILDGPVEIGPYCVVAERVQLGKGCVLQAHVHVAQDCSVGEDSVLEPYVAVLGKARIGKRNYIGTGAKLGVSGFGNPSRGGRFLRFPHVGVLVTEDDVHIGAQTCVARAALCETRLEEGVRVDNLVQIAHNCKVGAHTGIAGLTGMAGAVQIGKGCLIAGQVAFFGYQKIADGTVVMGQSGVYADIEEPGAYLGTPARPVWETHRIAIASARLPELLNRVKRLESHLLDDVE